MEKIFYIAILAALLCSCQGNDSRLEQTGNSKIYGSVVVNGEPVNAAAILLTPGGGTKITGSDGMYTFSDLQPGRYELKVYKEGFQTFNKSIDLTAGKDEELAITLTKSTGKLSINKAYIDMGSNESNNVAGFSILNTGNTDLDWEITNAASWITKIDPQNGKISANSAGAVVFTIDRSRLSKNVADNYTTLILRPTTSGDGSIAELLITVFGTGNGTGTTITNNDYVIIGDLYVQTKDLSRRIDWNSANSLCKNSIVGDYKDWRLPTIDELATIYTKKDAIGGFENYEYWSSTPYENFPIYYRMDFSNGRQTIDYSATNDFNVRAVRKDGEVNVSVTTINAMFAAGNYQFNITSNTAWTITSDKLWCTVQPSSDSGDREVNVSVTENTGETIRTALLTITAGKESKQITITQEPKGSSVFDNGIVAAENFGGGDGTQDTPYLIYNAQHLKKLVDDVNSENGYKNTYFKLITDIRVEAEWVPIGSIAYWDGFQGSFDGNGHIINGTLKSNKYSSFGFFGRCRNGAYISNLTIAASVINEFSNDNEGVAVGGITGTIGGEYEITTISNCYVTGTVIGGIGRENYTGGIVGVNEDGNIIDCTVSATVRGNGYNSFTGGIAGQNYWGENAKIINCSISNAAIIGAGTVESYTGGIAGTNGSLITGCTVSSGTNINTNGTNSSTGGITGRNRATYFSDIGKQCIGKIINCTNNSTIKGGDYATGGLAGENLGGVIHTGLNAGNISNNGGWIGGLAGKNVDDGDFSCHIYSCCTNSGTVNGMVANANNQIGDGKAVEPCLDEHTKR